MWKNLLLHQKSCLLCHQLSGKAVLCAGCLNDMRGLWARPSQQIHTADALWQDEWHSAHYEPPLPALLHDWKHLHRSAWAKVFHLLMLENPPVWLADASIDAILPMPISAKRRLQRGFNQCDELAQAISHQYGYPILPHQTIYRHHKTPQSSLNKAERQRNIRHSFHVRGEVAQQNLLLIDDIATTGATLMELTHTLKQAGAGNIWVWVMARKRS